MWFWIGVAVVAVAAWLLLQWRSRGGSGPRPFYQTRRPPSPSRGTMPPVGYYAERAARDPAWREAQVAAAAERKRRARERDPQAVREAERAACLRQREKQREVGLTFAELLRRSREAAGLTQSIGDREVLAWGASRRAAAGRIEYHAATRRYFLNGALDDETRAAFADLRL